MVEVFRAAAVTQIDALETSLRELGTAPETWAARKDEARDIAHNLKGQGESFGYPLITAIGQSLLGFLSDLGEADARGVKIALAHVTALRTVLDKDIRGAGGAAGAALVARLEGLSRPQA